MAEARTPERTMAQVVQAAADTYGSRVAIQDGEVSLTYTELNEARLQVAAAFHAAGLVKGDRIALWAPNIYQWILAATGAQTLGIIIVPINTRWKGSEAAFALNMSCARMLFTVGDFLGRVDPIRKRTCHNGLPEQDSVEESECDSCPCSSVGRALPW